MRKTIFLILILFLILFIFISIFFVFRFYDTQKAAEDTKVHEADVFIAADMPLYKDIKKSIVRGTQFLKDQLRENNHYLSCIYPDGSHCSLHGKGQAPVSFFVVDAIGSELTPQEKNKILSRIDREEKSGLWSYAPETEVDVDDTVFIMRTLRMLGRDVRADSILDFYSTEAEGFTTFLPRTDVTPKLVFQPSATTNRDVHPEVNANVYAFLLGTPFESYINSTIITETQTSQGYWRAYFDRSSYLTAYRFLEFLCTPSSVTAALSEEREKGISFILSTQNSDGSWGEDGDTFDTVFALNSLAACGIGGEQFQEGIKFLLKQQHNDGSWPSSQIVWEIHIEYHPLIVQRAYDVNRVVTTSSAVKVLTQALESDLFQ